MLRNRPLDRTTYKQTTITTKGTIHVRILDYNLPLHQQIMAAVLDHGRRRMGLLAHRNNNMRTLRNGQYPLQMQIQQSYSLYFARQTYQGLDP